MALDEVEEDEKKYQICYNLYECYTKKKELVKKPKPYKPNAPNSPKADPYNKKPTPNCPPPVTPNYPHTDYGEEAIKYLRLCRVYGNSSQKEEINKIIHSINYD